MQSNQPAKQDFSRLIQVALPLALTSTIQSSMTFFVTIFLARLGEHILAAGALVSWLFATLIVILFGTFSAVNVLISHKHGAKDGVGISLVLRDGLILAVILVIPTFLLLWYMAPIFILFGQSPTLAKLAGLYLHAMSWSLLPKFILIVLFELLIGLGHTRIIMIFTIISVPFYILFSYLFIFGKYGFPELGIAGAGWGMALGDWIATVTLIVYVLWHSDYRQYVSSALSMERPSFLGEILHLGVPMGLMYCIEVGFFFAMSLFMGVINIQSLAANQVSMQYLGLLIGVIFSISQAVTVRMGHELGANQAAAAERASYAGVYLSVIFMSVVAAIYWFMPKMLVSVFFNLNDSNNFLTINYAVKFLFIAAIFQVLESIRITLFGSLRGLKDTRFTLLTSIICFWCISLPLGYFISIKCGVGGEGFWWAMVVGVSCNVVLLYARFKEKMQHVFHSTNTIRET